MKQTIKKINLLEYNTGQIEEIWKDIPCYEGLYQASNFGRVKSLVGRHNTGPRVLRQSSDKVGYQILTLVKNKSKSTKTVHRLIASAFYGPNELPVNHKDGNKSNNQISNLEYVTAKENIQHAIRNKLLVHNTTMIAESKRRRVAQIDLQTGAVIKTYSSAHEAARITRFSRGNISNCCRGKVRQCNGFGFKYLN